MKQPSTLVMLTESYPFGGVTEPSFVRPEIEALAREFDRVILAPVLCLGEADQLPANVVADRSLLCLPGPAAKAKALFMAETWKHFFADRRQMKSPRQAVAALAFSTYALYYRRKLKALIANYKLDLRHTLFYSFWFEYHLAALSGIPGAKAITRAHGHEVYDSQNPFLSHSWRRESLASLLGCYAASRMGAEYIASNFPAFKEKITWRYLGSPSPLGLNPDGTSNQLSIISIARVSAEKGVVRLAEFLMQLAKERPLSWTHVGDGPEMARLESLAAQFPPETTVSLRGRMTNAEVHSLLASRHFDLLALTSFSEGLPIVVCEALSVGLPVVATAVGGLGEIVDSEVGALLGPDPTAEEFCQTVGSLQPRLAELRPNARKRWEAKFAAEKLRAQFAAEIRNFLP